MSSKPIEPWTKILMTFPYAGWLIGILTMVYNNPYKTELYNPVYTLNKDGFLIISELPFLVGHISSCC